MKKFNLKFTCEDCAHFDMKTGQCILGYPNTEHRLAYYTNPTETGWVVPCKDFELT